MTNRWYHLYSDQDNGKIIEQALQDEGVFYYVGYNGLVVRISFNVNENFWRNRLRKKLIVLDKPIFWAKSTKKLA